MNFKIPKFEHLEDDIYMRIDLDPYGNTVISAISPIKRCLLFTIKKDGTFFRHKIMDYYNPGFELDENGKIKEVY